MRDNHAGMPEIVAAYERDGLYFGVVRVLMPSDSAAFEFGVDRTGFLALRRILESRPFGSLPGVRQRFYFSGSYDKESISVRVEDGANGKQFSFGCPASLTSNLLWFGQIRELKEAGDLKRVAV